MGVAGWFVDQSGLQLGTTYLRGLTLKFVIFPRAEPFRGPTVFVAPQLIENTYQSPSHVP